MIPPLPDSVPSSTPSAPNLPRRHCMRHSQREPVAKCLGCGGALCRECVSQHDGKIYCVHCLAKLRQPATAPAATGRRWWPILRSAAETVLAVMVVWGIFYGIGAIAVRIPSEFHEGTMWQELVADEDEERYP